jgi:hypothetical protein
MAATKSFPRVSHASVARMRIKPAPRARWHCRVTSGLWQSGGLGHRKVGLPVDRGHGETISLFTRWATTPPRLRPYRRNPGPLIAGPLRSDMTRCLHPCGPDRGSRPGFWRHRRRIAQRSVGLFRGQRKFPCQGSFLASRSVAEQTNAEFGATGARQHSDQCAPVVDPSIVGACAFLQPRRGRGETSCPRQTGRGGRGISADARFPIRARADANRYRPQP